jgi:hypothetical protein
VIKENLDKADVGVDHDAVAVAPLPMESLIGRGIVTEN